MRSTSPCQPVVPTTIFLPALTQASIWPTTQEGAVKSITTSISRSFSVARAAPPALSADPATRMSCPRWRAASATSDPVFPRPRIRMCMKTFNAEIAEEKPRGGRRESFQKLERQRPPRLFSATSALEALSVHFRVRVRKKRPMQALDDLRYFIFLNHKGQVDLR